MWVIDKVFDLVPLILIIIILHDLSMLQCHTSTDVGNLRSCRMFSINRIKADSTSGVQASVYGALDLLFWPFLLIGGGPTQYIPYYNHNIVVSIFFSILLVNPYIYIIQYIYIHTLF